MPSTHGRRNLRLRRWDYSRDGAYFITISTVQNADLFGQVVRGEMRLNAVGTIVAESWFWLGSRYSHVTLDDWSVLPNHMHGILILTTRGAPVETSGSSGSTRPSRKPVGRLVGAFKTRSTKHVNLLRHMPGAPLWQRDFWDRVIRDEFELARIREYIRGNAAAYRPRTYTL